MTEGLHHGVGESGQGATLQRTLGLQSFIFHLDYNANNLLLVFENKQPITIAVTITIGVLIATSDENQFT